MDIDLTKFSFTADYVLVKAISTTETVKGLIRPEQYEDKPEFGEVIATGYGKMLEDGTLINPKASKGDLIFFGKYSSEKVRIKGEDYLIIRDDDIIAVQKKNA